MLLSSVVDVLTVRHFCALLLSVIIAVLATSHLDYRLTPLWVLHLHPQSSSDDWMPPDVNYLMRSTVALPSYRSEGEAVPSVRLIISNSHINTGAFVVIYHLSSISVVESLLLHSERRASALHQLGSASRFTFKDQHILAVTANSDRRGLVYAVVSIPAHNSSSSIANSYLISTFNESGTVLWKQTIRMPDFSISDVVPVITIDTRCGIVSTGVCGVVFAMLPSTLENDHQFSTLALSLADGTILWQYRQDKPTLQAHVRNCNSTRTHWKLALLDYYESHRHVDVSSWKKYRDRLTELLPFQWYGPSDSQIAVLTEVNPQGEAAPIPNKHIPSLLTTLHPQGIDLLDPASGKPMSQLPFDWRPGATYAFISSVNDSRYFFRSLGRNVLTQLSIHSIIVPSSLSSSTTYLEQSSDDSMDNDVPVQGDFSHMVDCRGILRRLEVGLDSSGVDVDSQSVIHSGLCRPHSLFDFARLGRPDWLEDERKSVPPLVFNRDFQSNGLVALWNDLFPSLAVHPKSISLLHKHHTQMDVYDMVFLTSDGSLTSVTNNGHENWRVNAEVSWLQVSRNVAGEASDSNNVHEMYNKYFVPSLSAVRLRPFGLGTWGSLLIRKEASVYSDSSLDRLSTLSLLVSVGWDSLSLVDRDSGRLLATHRLPSHPTGKPILIPLSYSTDKLSGDVQFVNSLIVIPCDGMLVAFGLTMELRLLTLILLLLCLFISFIFLNLFCTLEYRSNEY